MNAKLKEYAALLVETGVNIQKGQTLIIFCPVDHAEFARECARAAYQKGCREVVMSWMDNDLTRMKYLHADESVFNQTPRWSVDFYTDYAKEKAAFLHLRSEDPKNLLGVDANRILNAQKSSGLALKEYRELRNKNCSSWCIGCLSSPKWAQIVFPKLDEASAVEALWEKIFMAVRVTGDGTAVEEWKEHSRRLRERMAKLNDYNFASLHYKNSLGTDLVVELAKGHVWEAGGDVTADGQFYMPNMPTEEIFTAPKRDGVNGVVCASMPLCRNGNVMDGLRFEIINGRIEKASASQGEEQLINALALDEGARYFGEVALVPFDSPISNSNTLYYETLYDENASCHFAFGRAYASTVKGGIDMTKEELFKAGLNDSMTHVDFMVGTKDLSITGTTHDGRQIPVFVDGNFAF
ncbi:MAG: aminopeptidase [Eubacteriales bacterium]|nr:aminopeptidase [Eubacteriales bacterium]